MSTLRSALRAKALKPAAPRSCIVVFGEDKDEYEVRAPSVRARNTILGAAGALTVDNKDAKASNKVDAARLQVAAIIACTFEPGTNERIFDVTDTEMLLDDPAGGIVDALAKPALDFLNAAGDKEAAKNG